MDLSELRTEIDAIDSELVRLFGKRMDIAAQVAEESLSYLKGEKEYGQAKEMSDFYRKLVTFSSKIRK